MKENVLSLVMDTVSIIFMFCIAGVLLCVWPTIGVPKQFLIFGESGGTSRPYQLAEWFGLCDLVGERDRHVFHRSGAIMYLNAHKIDILFAYVRKK